MEKMEKCPNCPDGGQTTWAGGSLFPYRAYCRTCLTSGPLSPTPEAAIAAWNRVAALRADNDMRIRWLKIIKDMAETHGDWPDKYLSVLFDISHAAEGALPETAGEK